MQSIVSTGKNIEEAIGLGLELMEVTKKEVNIEIIQQETKGLMGIGRKKAIVKLSKNNTADKGEITVVSPELDLLDTFEELVDELPLGRSSDDGPPLNDYSKKMGKIAGRVWVKDGKIYVKDAPGTYPTITTNEGIQLIKNREVIKEKTVAVCENDTLETYLEEEIHETSWKINMDKHKLKATLEIAPGYKLTRKLADTSPSEHIKLVVEEAKEVINSLDYNEVWNELEAQNISYGVNQTEILNAINATELSSFEIATGKKTKPGKDGSISIKVDTDIKTTLTESESGKINFRESRIIPTVAKGDVLGIIQPPVIGKEGITVTNEILPPPKVHPVTVKIGTGVIEEENKVIAIESGRPLIQKRAQLIKISITPKLVHNRDVDISTGNIRFDGDVEITGEVKENMQVEAGNDIIVYKSINESNLVSLNSIVAYGNVASSVLTAGKNNMLIVELGKLLEMMHFQTETMISFITQLTQAPAFKSSDFNRKGIQPLIRILLEKKFDAFSHLAKEYVNKVNADKSYLEENWLKAAKLINQYFLTLSAQAITMQQVKELSGMMRDLYEFSKTPEEPGSYLTISNALNSSLYCSGNILIIGKGCINTKVYAGGQLKVTGILRGGEVFGSAGVDINEVGSPGGTKTIIAVPVNETIQIKKAYEGTTLKIGKAAYTLVDTKNYVTARLSTEGQIVFE